MPLPWPQRPCPSWGQPWSSMWPRNCPYCPWPLWPLSEWTSWTVKTRTYYHTYNWSHQLLGELLCDKISRAQIFSLVSVKRLILEDEYWFTVLLVWADLWLWCWDILSGVNTRVNYSWWPGLQRNGNGSSKIRPNTKMNILRKFERPSKFGISMKIFKASKIWASTLEQA